MRKTKIIGTIGPACMEYAVLKKMVSEGLNIARINLSHAKVEDMEIILQNVKRVRQELNVPLPIMLDTRGPELRVKTFEKGQVEIKKGQTFTFTARKVIGNETIVSLNLPKIVRNIKVGDKILAVNGLLIFKVVEKTETDLVTKAQNSGILSNRKSLSVPNVKFNTPYLNEKDKSDILWGIKNDIDLIAASFVNSKADVLALRKFIESNGGDMKIIAKIESQRGVDNLDEVIEASDAVMVARGDLGVELPVEKLPEIQKIMINKARSLGKSVIIATEMLESMINNNRPTRAEVSDVANAVYDGTSAIMLSGETASGKYPIEAVRTMHKIAVETEMNIDYHAQFECGHYNLKDITDIISHSAVDASFFEKTKAIVVFTSVGLSAQMISRFRPSVQIIGATPNEKTYRQLELRWGVHPVLTSVYNTTDEMFSIANELVKREKIAKTLDRIVITCGTPKQNGSTNLIKIDEVR